MFSYRGLGSHRRVDRGLGKFQPVAVMGTSSEREAAYEGWTLRTWGASVGLARPRERYSVRLVDPAGLEVKHLSGFSSRQAAEEAAREWIARAIQGAEVRRRRVEAARGRNART